jgi:2-polyprenyl-3-methyl-5-hydroxy-6-metoxy-1,4-benzoquinol methylase
MKQYLVSTYEKRCDVLCAPVFWLAMTLALTSRLIVIAGITLLWDTTGAIQSERPAFVRLMHKISAAIGKRWGNRSVKQKVWDSEYSSGQWTYIRGTNNNEKSEPIYSFLVRYGANGSILDLGCGSGMTALEMENNFDKYVGVDVSRIAIEKARTALSMEVDRASKVCFVTSDISKFEPPHRFSVILFRESIYYVPKHRIKRMLKHYCTHLLPDGVIIVRLCDRHKYRSIVRILEADFQGKELFAATDSLMSIYVCSPRSI